MRIYLLIFALFLSFTSFSQSLITDSGIVLKKGIYKTLEEFRHNNPSINLNFKIEEKPDFNAPDIKEATIYYLSIPKGSLTQTDTVWGICDGKNIYISKEKLYKKNQPYYKLSFIGLFSIYSRMEISNVDIGNNPGVGQIYNGKTYKIRNYIFNINQGKTYELDKGMFTTILDNDPELTDEFKNLKRGPSHYVEYIKRYSIKHRDQVKP